MDKIILQIDANWFVSQDGLAVEGFVFLVIWDNFVAARFSRCEIINGVGLKLAVVTIAGSRKKVVLIGSQGMWLFRIYKWIEQYKLQPTIGCML